MGLEYDVIVSGGGPGGASAAYRAASAGAKVLVCDKARFPRDKACGDGLTPRAVKLLTEMGLEHEFSKFQQVARVQLVSESRSVTRGWPERPGLPGHAYVAARHVLDQIVLDRAREVGAEVREGTEVLGPVIEDGVVRGVRARGADGVAELRAPVVIAADGMSSRLGRAVGMVPADNSVFAVAVRAQVPSSRVSDDLLECHLTLRHRGRLLPGYGWVFPMVDGMVNIGIGYLSTYKRYKELNANQVMSQFLGQLPVDWRLPSVVDMLGSGQLRGWRLPMALHVWPPWRPGIMAVGDAVGAAKPYTGAGISKALQSGLLAGEVAVDALGSGDPANLRQYEQRLNDTWSSYYRLGRFLARVAGRPSMMRLGIALGMGMQLGVDVSAALLTGNGERLDRSSGLPGQVATAMIGAARFAPADRAPADADQPVVLHEPSRWRRVPATASR